MAERRSAWREKGVTILGLGVGQTPDDVRRFFAQTGKRATFPLYFAPWFAEREKVEGTPTLFILTASGEKVFRVDGMEDHDLPKLANEKLDQLLSGRK